MSTTWLGTRVGAQLDLAAHTVRIGVVVFVNPRSAAITWRYDLLVLNGRTQSFDVSQALGDVPLGNIYCDGADAPSATTDGTVAVAQRHTITVDLTWPRCKGKSASPPKGVYTLVLIARSLTAQLISLDSQIVSFA